jgi:diguanylate cyclase (GGDEF)-like protein
MNFFSNKMAASLGVDIPYVPKTSFLVLIVDDDVFMRTQIRRLLEKEHYQVIEASNGKEGLDACRRLSPDIVLLDAVMPQMDGFECCANLQTFFNTARVPVLMITGLEDQQSVDQAFEVGAVDYVTKPIHWAVLRQRVRRLIQQAQLHQQLEAANRVFHQLAIVDSLTQLANRRQFDACLQQEWQRMMREQNPLTLILCDVDFFKNYNDTYGHQAGDECLQKVAHVIGSCVRRSSDLAARYGGEEFAIILPNTPISGAVRIVESIQADVAALQIPHASSAVSEHVTLSLGIVSVSPRVSAAFSPENLIANVDEALYQAKAQGRDRYCIYSPDHRRC